MPEALDPYASPWLAARACRDPEATALVCDDRAIAWAALAARADALAAGLVARGIAAGERVATLMGTSPDLVALVHAAQRCGAALVLLSTRLAPPEIAALLAHARPRLVVHDREHAATLAPDAVAASPAVTPDELAAAAPARVPPACALDPGAALTVLYTSGTTGRAKGVILTNANHAASAAASRANLGVRAGDRWLAVLPLHHVGGLAIVLRAVLDGVPVILQRRFEPAAASAALRGGGATLASMVPTMLARLLAHDGDERFAPRVRALLVGGGPIPAALLAQARARGLPVVPTYGLTEAASQVTTGSAGDAAAVPGPARGAPALLASAGRALPGVEVRIDRPGRDGGGEILVRGANVMRGYLDDPAATAAALRDGWLHTGDIGRLDDAGFLHVLDRRTDLVVTGGENVYPAEVEAVLHAHPAVLEAAVYARRDAEWGQRVAAAVVVRPGRDVDDGELRAWCRTRLAAYKVPRTIERVPALPRTASGKLRRHLLA